MATAFQAFAQGTRKDPEREDERDDAEESELVMDAEHSELFNRLGEGNDLTEKKKALAQVQRSMLTLTESAQGCLIVQRAFEVAGCGEQTALAAQLHNHVSELYTSAHGSEVLESIIQFTLPAAASFIAKEILGSASNVARHRDGYRVICRILEHLPHE